MIVALAKAGAVVSVDTRRAMVMREALSCGARIVNDVTALTFDPEGLATVARGGASVVLMHMQGEPATMQKAPRYANAPAEIAAYLADRVSACREAGMAADRIAVDPGIGFGKTVEHNLQILAAFDRFREIGVAVAVGASRKSFIGKLSRGEPPKERERRFDRRRLGRGGGRGGYRPRPRRRGDAAGAGGVAGGGGGPLALRVCYKGVDTIGRTRFWRVK